MSKRFFMFLIVAYWLGIAAGFSIRGILSPTPQEHMNDLIRVGFVMFDPEGHKIERWED